ncbi:MAG TPA: hypothetical protein DEF42_08875 [Desulfosporosinus sp.]|nr:hypothetical protein [Desulfosporosinus sp.]
MSKIKAVVLEKSGSRYTVLAENGTFRHIRRRKEAEIGEEIEIQTSFEGFKGLRAWASVAAIFFLTLSTIFAWNLYQAPTAVALLSVDINPSIQFSIDAQGQLIKIVSQSEDAEDMVREMDLKGKPIDEVLGQIINEAYNQKFLNSERSWVVVGYSSLTEDGLDEDAEDLNESQIVSWITETVEEKGFTPQVEYFALTPQDRELAQKGNLTLGEYALWQTAIKAGVVTEPEKLKDTSEREKLLKNPKVQAQVKENKKAAVSSSPSKGQISGQDKANNQKSQNYEPQKDQKDKNVQDKEMNKKDRNSNTDIDGDKENNNDKDRNSNNRSNEKDRVKSPNKDNGNLTGKDNTKALKKSDMQLNTSDKVRNNQVNGIMSTSFPWKWGASRF